MIRRLECAGRSKIREIGAKKGGCRKIVIFPSVYERKILARRLATSLDERRTFFY